MTRLSTTKMSSKGQVVIPEEIRQHLGLEPGIQFVVVGDRDVIVLKAIAPPAMAPFDELISEARKQAREAKVKREDADRVSNASRSRK